MYKTECLASIIDKRIFDYLTSNLKTRLKIHTLFYLESSVITEKETQKGKYKNPKVQKSKRCEIVKSNKRNIQKSKS